MNEPKKKIRKGSIVSAIIVLLGNVLFFLTLWLLQQYDQISFDQCLYQMKTASSGVHFGLLGSIILRVGVFSIAATAAEIFLYMVLSGRVIAWKLRWEKYEAYGKGRFCQVIDKGMGWIAGIFLLLCAIFMLIKLEVVTYVVITSQDSKLIEEQYVDPSDVSLEFPEEKRNLIYIFLESMENTYADTDACSAIETDYIPELTALADEYVSFSNTESMGGPFSYNGTTWTTSAMVSQTAGVPIKVPLISNEYGGSGKFMAGLTTLGEILAEHGYSSTLLLGSDAQFHGKELYFQQHGDYDIVDIGDLKQAGRLDEDYLVWWGFEDEKLFAYAKEEATRLAQTGEPFNLTLLTADSHFPNGYKCRLCENEHDTQYANVLSCSSRQVYAFVTWLQEQPFYENTTIVLSGDHLTMDPLFLEDLDEQYTRTTYNCIINSPIEPVREKNREFATFDMMPTTLAALGVKIEGDRLALGTNLFSAEETLTEIFGYDVLNLELQKNSDFYNKELLEMP